MKNRHIVADSSEEETHLVHKIHTDAAAYINFLCRYVHKKSTYRWGSRLEGARSPHHQFGFINLFTFYLNVEWPSIYISPYISPNSDFTCAQYCSWTYSTLRGSRSTSAGEKALRLQIEDESLTNTFQLKLTMTQTSLKVRSRLLYFRPAHFLSCRNIWDSLLIDVTFWSRNCENPWWRAARVSRNSFSSKIQREVQFTSVPSVCLYFTYRRKKDFKKRGLKML